MALGLAAPLTAEAAREAWRATAARLDPHDHVLYAAFDGDALVGAVQLVRATSGNGRHRAEVKRLAVRADRRGEGVGTALLRHLVAEAGRRGITLLWLTTHAGTAADRIYERLGWTRMGEMPDYSTLPDGSLAANAFYYKRLPAAPQPS